MQNFKLLDTVDVTKLKAQVLDNYHLFVDLGIPEKKKGDVGYSHRQGQLITVRYPHIPEDISTNPETYKRVSDDLFAINYEPWHIFTELKPLLYALMFLVQGTHLGGVGIINLGAGRHIEKHFDTGQSTIFYNRYHIILCGRPECWFTCGKGTDREQVAMRDGEVWYFDSRKQHSVVNNDTRDRISVSIDIGRQ